MLNVGPTGFYKAPLCKAIFVIVGGISASLSILQKTPLLHIQGNTLSLRSIEYWKFLLYPFGFTKTSEVLYGSILLYFCRLYERRYGTSKYAIFAVFVTMLAAVIQMSILPITAKYGILRFATGPYSLIFATVLQYFIEVPRTQNIQLFRRTWSDKTVVFFIALQLFFSSGVRSIIPGICGLLGGTLYRLNFLYIKSLALPVVLRNFGRKYIEPFLSSTDPVKRTSSNFVFRDASVSRGPPLSSTPSTLPEVTLPPSEENIHTLVSMGFSREASIRALQRSNNHLHRASNLLIDGQS